MPTARRFTQQIIILADEFIVVQHIELFASAELFAADATCKAIEVEYFVARLTYEIGGSDALTAATAFCAVAPMECTKEIQFQFRL